MFFIFSQENAATNTVLETGEIKVLYCAHFDTSLKTIIIIIMIRLISGLGRGARPEADTLKPFGADHPCGVICGRMMLNA